MTLLLDALYKAGTSGRNFFIELSKALVGGQAHVRFV